MDGDVTVHLARAVSMRARVSFGCLLLTNSGWREDKCEQTERAMCVRVVLQRETPAHRWRNGFIGRVVLKSLSLNGAVPLSLSPFPPAAARSAAVVRLLRARVKPATLTVTKYVNEDTTRSTFVSILKFSVGVIGKIIKVTFRVFCIHH